MAEFLRAIWGSVVSLFPACVLATVGLQAAFRANDDLSSTPGAIAVLCVTTAITVALNLGRSEQRRWYNRLIDQLEADLLDEIDRRNPTSPTQLLRDQLHDYRRGLTDEPESP